jgi:hypothetical protein
VEHSEFRSRRVHYALVGLVNIILFLNAMARFVERHVDPRPVSETA